MRPEGFDFLPQAQEYRAQTLRERFARAVRADLVKPEEDLIREALEGNSRSYGELVERFQARLFNAMLQVVGSHDEAEDVVQDSFVQAYVKLDTFQGNSKFFTWLYRIAFNNALSRQRRKRHDLSIEQSREITGSDPQDNVESPDEPLLREERISMVHNALGMLSDEHRSILVLREMESLSYEEISEILSINIGTVRSRLSRARNQLKTHLQEIQQQ